MWQHEKARIPHRKADARPSPRQAARFDRRQQAGEGRHRPGESGGVAAVGADADTEALMPNHTPATPARPKRIERCNSWCKPDASGICEFCGWSAEDPPGALRIWDDARADYRDATQLDIDTLKLTEAAYHRLREQVMAVHARLQDDVRVLRSKAGAPHQGVLVGAMVAVPGAVERVRERLATVDPSP